MEIFKEQYKYSLMGNEGTVLESKVYKYENNNWKDQLTSYDGKTIKYDDFGNVISYNGNTYNWADGSKLIGVNDNM